MSAAIPGLQDVSKAPDRPADKPYQASSTSQTSSGAGAISPTPSALPASQNQPVLPNPGAPGTGVLPSPGAPGTGIAPSPGAPGTGVAPNQPYLPPQTSDSGVPPKPVVVTEQQAPVSYIKTTTGQYIPTESLTAEQLKQYEQMGFQTVTSRPQDVYYDISSMTPEQRAFVKNRMENAHETLQQAMSSSFFPGTFHLKIRTPEGIVEQEFKGTAVGAQEYAKAEEIRYMDKTMAQRGMSSVVNIKGRPVGIEGYRDTSGAMQITKFVNPTDEDYFRENYTREETKPRQLTREETLAKIGSFTSALPQMEFEQPEQTIKTDFGQPVRQGLNMTYPTGQIYAEQGEKQKQMIAQAKEEIAARKAGQEWKEGYSSRFEYNLPTYMKYENLLTSTNEALDKFAETGPIGQIGSEIGRFGVGLMSIPTVVIKGGPETILSFGAMASVSPRVALGVTYTGAQETTKAMADYYATHPYALATAGVLMFPTEVAAAARWGIAGAKSVYRGLRVGEEAAARMTRLGRLTEGVERALGVPIISETDAFGRAIEARTAPMKPLPVEFKTTPMLEVTPPIKVKITGEVKTLAEKPPERMYAESYTPEIFNPITDENLIKPSPQPLVEPILPVPTRPVETRPIIFVEPPISLEQITKNSPKYTIDNRNIEIGYMAPDLRNQIGYVFEEGPMSKYDIVKAGRVPPELNPMSQYDVVLTGRGQFGEAWENTLKYGGRGMVPPEFPAQISPGGTETPFVQIGVPRNRIYIDEYYTAPKTTYTMKKPGTTISPKEVSLEAGGLNPYYDIDFETGPVSSAGRKPPEYKVSGANEFQDTLEHIKYELSLQESVGKAPIEIWQAPANIGVMPKKPEVKYQYSDIEGVPLSPRERFEASRGVTIDLRNKKFPPSPPAYSEVMREGIETTFEKTPVYTEKTITIEKPVPMGEQMGVQLETTTQLDKAFDITPIRKTVMTREGRYDYGYAETMTPTGEKVFTLQDIEPIAKGGYVSGTFKRSQGSYVSGFQPVYTERAFQPYKDYGLPTQKEYTIFEGGVTEKGKPTEVNKYIGKAPGDLSSIFRTTQEQFKEAEQTGPTKGQEISSTGRLLFLSEPTMIKPLESIEPKTNLENLLKVQTAEKTMIKYKAPEMKLPKFEYPRGPEGKEEKPPKKPPKKPPEKEKKKSDSFKKDKKGLTGGAGFAGGIAIKSMARSDLLSRMKSQAKYGTATEISPEFAKESLSFEKRYLGGYVPTQEQLESGAKPMNALTSIKSSLSKLGGFKKGGKK